MDHVIAGLRLASFFGTTGVFFALGFAGVCRWLKWYPINVTVNVYQNGEKSPQQEKR